MPELVHNRSRKGSKMKSIIVFTIHKAASMFLYTFTKKLAAASGLPYYSVHDGTILNHSPDILLGRHGCFCPIREYLPIVNPEDYTILLHLRDPRDVLVSYYFSVAYSHGRKKGGFNPSADDRNEWIQMGLDKHVLENADSFYERYSMYTNNLLGKPNVTLLSYEEMVWDFPTWLYKYTSVFPLPQRDGFLESSISSHKNEFTVKSENIYVHKRQIVPGDHKRKLASETIEALNIKFADILDSLGYER